MVIDGRDGRRGGHFGSGRVDPGYDRRCGRVDRRVRRGAVPAEPPRRTVAHYATVLASLVGALHALQVHYETVVVRLVGAHRA